MIAVILAAGKGRRLGELTKDRPKPMLEVGGKPLLEHLVTNLKEAGINKIYIKVDYLRSQIIKHFGSDVEYLYSKLEHLEFLEANDDLFQGRPFFVLNGDTMSNVDYQSMIELNRAYPTEIIELVDEWRCAGTWLYPSTYFSDQDVFLVYPYRMKGLKWNDINTPERLKEAREAW